MSWLCSQYSCTQPHTIFFNDSVHLSLGKKHFFLIFLLEFIHLIYKNIKILFISVLMYLIIFFFYTYTNQEFYFSQEKKLKQTCHIKISLCDPHNPTLPTLIVYLCLFCNYP